MAAAALTVIVAGCNAGGAGGSGSVGGGEAVATVNGDSVGRNDLHRFLEAVNGESALRQLIDHQLIAQELKKQGLSVSEQEIDAAVAEQKRQQSGPALEEFERITKAAGPGLEALRRNLRSEISLNRLVTKDIKVDEAQLKKWFEKNKARYGKPATVKLGVLLASTKARADLMAQQIKKKTKTFAQLVEEQKKANDPIGARSITDTPSFPADSLKQQLGPVLGAQAAKMKQGDISPVLSLGTAAQQAYGIIRLAASEPATKPDFAALRPQLEQEYKLEQLARKQVPNFEQAVKQIEAGLMQQGMQQGRMEKPSYRQVLDTLVASEKQKLIARLRETAQVSIADASFARVADSYKPQPGPAGAPAAGAPAAGAPPAGALDAPAGAPPGAPAGG